jgi:regulator of nucleoside diphosphate kinase
MFRRPASAGGPCSRLYHTLEKTMSPNITMSKTDFNRIDLMLEKLAAVRMQGKEALSNELLRAQVVEPWEVPPMVVTMNSTVCFRLDGGGPALCRTLVYPKDAGLQPDTLSVLTPVGSALLGLSEGDRMEWTHPDGRALTVEVLQVLYQPERAGDFHL